jgi:hypothetical protein
MFQTFVVKFILLKELARCVQLFVLFKEMHCNPVQLIPILNAKKFAPLELFFQVMPNNA